MGKARVFDKKNDKITTINLNKYFTDKESSKKLLPIIKQLPGQVLLEFAEKPVDFSYIEYHNDVDCSQRKAQNAHASWCSISFGDFEDTISEDDALFGTLTHEIGHYIDFNSDHPGLAYNAEVIALYKEECEAFVKYTSKEQQKYLDYFMFGLTSDPNQERIAEAHSILYSKEMPALNMRRYYFAQYFPRTMAAIMKLLLEEEGVDVK